MNKPRTMTTRPVMWHEDAVKRAVDHAKAMLQHSVDDMPIVRSGHNAPLTYQDVAVFVDLATALEAERIDFASNSATLGYVTDALNEVLDDYWQTRPENLPQALEILTYNIAVLAWLHAESQHNLNHVLDRERWRRESEHVGYVDHMDELIEALGQHADPNARTLKRLITGDVVALRESYDAIETELIEWRTGQRTADTNAEQWAQVNAMLDETLTTVRQLASHVEAEHVHVEGQLPVEPLKFTHDVEDDPAVPKPPPADKAWLEVTPDGR